MLTVVVNNRPIDLAAIEQRGRVLLPMRQTFAALGASVGYNPDGRVIVARNSMHAVRLSIGSPWAVVDGHRVKLDVPAQVIANTTYVPVRFVAQAMGAIVGYDARAQIVSVSENVGMGSTSSQNVSVVGLTPAPQSVVASAYPTISASLGAASAARNAISLTIDGLDVTADASFDGATITYMPRTGLSQGSHTVVFSGRTLTGDPFNSQWSFSTSLQAPPDMPSPSFYDYRFYSEGGTTFYPGDWMHFILYAPPGGSAELQLCGIGYDYAMWNGGSGSVYEADVPAPQGYWIPSCEVTALYRSWSGTQVYVPMPVFIGLYTGAQPTPRPGKTPRPIPIPPGKRRPEPAPTPAPQPKATPIVVHPLPLPIRPHEPIVHPMPLRVRTPEPIAPVVRTPLPVVHTPVPRPHHTSAPIASPKSKVPSYSARPTIHASTFSGV